MKILKLISFSLVMVTCSLLMIMASSAYAFGDRPNILILGEDADSDSIQRNSRVFQRVVNTLSQQMQSMGFDVYDETAITLTQFEQGRIRRSKAELIDIGRSIRKLPIDVVLVFKIYASLNNKSYVQKVSAYIEGQMIDVNSGKFLGSFEVKSPNDVWTAPADCSRECVLNVVGDYAKVLANDLGAILAENLALIHAGSIDANNETVLGSDYNLIFDNFSSEIMAEIEEYLVIFSGYQAHRPIYSSARRFEIFYQSTIPSAKLQRNLNKMLAQLELGVRTTFSGNTFTIERYAFHQAAIQSSSQSTVQSTTQASTGGW